MAKFARDCIEEHILKTKELELSLGPDTSTLKLRVGLHSGPITAGKCSTITIQYWCYALIADTFCACIYWCFETGVLRGQKSRFQLFGDTVNTCARMESSGVGNAIHISKDTADLLVNAGKKDWVAERTDVVNLKGKGQLKTFWLLMKKNDKQQQVMVTNEVDYLFQISLDLKTKRLVDWNVDILLRLIRRIVARRNAECGGKRSRKALPKSNPSLTAVSTGVPKCNPLDEVVEVIELPEFNQNIQEENPDSIVLDQDVARETQEYVTTIATLYRENPFHNFEHASHVCMSVAKLMNRIVAPSDMDFSDAQQAQSKLHDHTYGITSDPLTQLACVVSALIHDVDHQGVPNSQLIKENDPLASLYNGKSVAEQNSVDISWEILMEPRFANLRSVICPDESSLNRFRKLVVNSVLATDIMDKDLKQLRNARWEKAFAPNCDETDKEQINRKATIVIEHLIQASDVAHTMQHWTIYRKWNAKLFKEMYTAFKEGRAEKDPSQFWYEGEIGFFDFYIIPLAKKLKDCGVFGVSSDEYLQYAQSNRNEWEQKGKEVVEDLIASVENEDK
jgi:hypothetical protein